VGSQRQDAAAMVRDYTKWDDNPVSLTHFAESAVRRMHIATTPAMGPVVLIADAVLQEEPIPEADRQGLRVPRLSVAGPPAGDSAAISEAARLLVAAETPVIIAGRCARTPNGLKLLVELAETLQAPVQDRPFRFRMNFPTRHPLYGGGSIVDADVVLGLEDSDFWQAIHTQTPVNRMGMVARPVTKPGAKLITISSAELASKSNYQDFGRYAEVDLAIAADAEASLPMLIEACKRLITADRKKVFQERGAKLAEASRRAREQTLDQAAWGWDASPITTARLSAEVWNEIQNEDWSLVSDVTFLSFWPTRMWDFNKHHHYIGGQGAYGIGYGAPAAVGAALANRKHGRLTVNIQCDGDLNYAPGSCGRPRITAFRPDDHAQQPAYHQERMYIEDMAARAGGIDRADIGTSLTLNIDCHDGEGVRRTALDRSEWKDRRRSARHRRGEARAGVVDVHTQPR
jgi:thiamine pyrophosphate-dependent acetolactate synthase large subunit-like protein